MGSHKLPKLIVLVTLVLLFLIGCGAPAATPAPAAATSAPGAATSAPGAATSAPVVIATRDLEATPLPSTQSPPVYEPPKASTAGSRVATSPDDIVGTWRAGASHIRFNKDGTCNLARALEDLDKAPMMTVSFKFEGTKVSITEIKSEGMLPCGDTVGVYEMRILADGKLQISASGDKCMMRAREFEGDYEAVR